MFKNDKHDPRKGFTPYQQSIPVAFAAGEKVTGLQNAISKRRKFSCGTGFTLIEVLIVVALIAILASLIMPRFGGQVERSAAAEAIGIMGVLRQAVEAYNQENGSYPTDLTESTLGVTYTTPKFWNSPTTDGAGNVTAQRMAGASCNGTLTLAPNGTWSGTDDYTRTTGKCWPQLR